MICGIMDGSVVFVSDKSEIKGFEALNCLDEGLLSFFFRFSRDVSAR